MTSSPSFVSQDLFHMHSNRKFRRNWTGYKLKVLLSSIQFSLWAAPIVPVLKKDGLICIFGEVTGARQCYRCGGKNHLSDACRFKEMNCRACGKKGHLSKVCRSQRKPNSSLGRPQDKPKFIQWKTTQKIRRMKKTTTQPCLYPQPQDQALENTHSD